MMPETKVVRSGEFIRYIQHFVGRGSECVFCHQGMGRFQWRSVIQSVNDPVYVNDQKRPGTAPKDDVLQKKGDHPVIFSRA
jgi:hypothetical protein